MGYLYKFTDYSPEWELEFKEEAKRLREILKDELVTIYHIGSTSIPGLASKAIIDLLPVVRNLEYVDIYKYVFEEAGYEIWGEYGISGRRYFSRTLGGYRTHNIHVYQAGNREIDRHIAFCEYLRSHNKECKEYEDLKRKLYAKHPLDIEAYKLGKNTWIKQMEQVALKWFYKKR